MPIMFLPFFSTLIVGLAMYLVLGQPVAAAQNAITSSLKNMQAGGAKFSLGAIIGAMMGFDLGGPVNKTASAFCNALLAENIMGPTAAKIVGGMTPALGIAAAVLAGGRKRWNAAQHEAAKAALPLGLCFITEGVLPFAAADPIRVIIATCAGSAVAGGLTQLWNVACPVPHGGIFVIPTMTNPLGFIAALLIGSFITFVIYYGMKYKTKQPTQTQEDSCELDALELEL